MVSQKMNAEGLGVIADSDDLARVYRFDLAHHSDLMSPGARGVLAVWFLASAKPRGQS
ncbi:hypothetical protein HAP48_0004445 [Bradyrhizobium septentrionale]|uniref:Uncharacterized protein n=1 Tax=Bradyrhizobium septentrionale TaxID=1404411 RepID=A0A974A4W7_9BRAD|nr:hypothetical protein [Bradyrhizobium septentrionale]UGY16792.1 hypothetical protein HAP48_0004445 [Bradyrhizobium septentrionale]